MKQIHKNASFLLLMASLGLGVGCGSGSEPPTKAAFITEADAICRKADKAKIAAMQAAAKKTPVDQMGEAELMKTVISVSMPPLATEAKELQELSTPEGDAAKIESMAKGIEEAIERAEADPQTLAKESTNPFKQVNAEGKSYGFKDCSEFS